MITYVKRLEQLTTTSIEPLVERIQQSDDPTGQAISIVDGVQETKAQTWVISVQQSKASSRGRQRAREKSAYVRWMMDKEKSAHPPGSTTRKRKRSVAGVNDTQEKKASSRGQRRARDKCAHPDGSTTCKKRTTRVNSVQEIK
jgi:hypothetical protein